MSDDEQHSKQDAEHDVDVDDSKEDEEQQKDADNKEQPSSTPWQAIYSPQYNAYYFFNSETQETTWENPLVPSAASSSSQTPAPEESSSSTPSASANQRAALEAAAIAAGIDPSLAHLDPTLLTSIPGSSASSSTGLPPSFTAKFNARTGQFARPDARDPTHLSEQARAMRMSEFYFDVNAWENQLAEQGGSIMGNEEGKKRKRPSKKDLERFREQKKAKKLAKTAWLRT
ncbi:hypothetical protein H0H92_009091 [Tricholoma furcatifolium]|nr:hypothetical protein H0H92_009091 [Tricholoma furcatifolium]